MEEALDPLSAAEVPELSSLPALYAWLPSATGSLLRKAISGRATRYPPVVQDVLGAVNAAFHGDTNQAIRRLGTLTKSRRTSEIERAYVLDILSPFLFTGGRLDEARQLVSLVRDVPRALEPAFCAARSIMAAEAGERAKSKRFADRALRLATQTHDRAMLGRVLNRVALAAYYRASYSESYVRALEAAQVLEQIPSHWSAASAYTILIAIAGDSKHDIRLAFTYSKKLVEHGRLAGHLPLVKVGLGNLIAFASASLDRELLRDARAELSSTPMPEQYAEEFPISVAEAVGHGWEGDFDVARRSLELLPESSLHNGALRSMRDALLAVAFLAHWDIDDARRFSRQAIAESKRQRARPESLTYTAYADAARIVAAACCILLGDVTRGRRALNARVDPQHRILDAIGPNGIDLSKVPQTLRGYGEYLNAAVDSAAKYRPGSGLTPAELEVLRLLPGEGSLRDIAASLGKSQRTVAHQVESIYSKLHVSSRLQAIERARLLRILH